ncbi:iron-sulfur cluster repair di-iron protein [Mangrovivirga sp. M17]|uniref:Iron-sulfur cluster repair di-iron protein n=1 Tax=Mangrovivirga halotolerans TaxID=2993936 RepID=A0ABT3RP14_9BACT|nr:iron-sulfur cluster repair di-iron protein [Mangrovivirga halotolerans]MCX2743555.1 iron-sulfur cluster repair di-iron protein [Mangrovivirga halotolerans]
MQNFIDSTVAEIVADNYKYAEIFKKYHIDFCCKGNIPLKDACDKQSISPDLVIKDLEEVTERPSDYPDYSEWNTVKLIEYIVNVHHTYVKETIPLLIEFSWKVARVHGHSHPETITIHKLVKKLADDLITHLYKEEQIIFPSMLYRHNLLQSIWDSKPSEEVKYTDPLEVMHEEHETAGEIIQSISELSNGYQPPEDACATFKVLYQKLEEFEKDLNTHIHLENNVLFPKFFNGN